MAQEIIILIVALVVLGVAAHYMVNAAIHIAKLLKLPTILIGLTIVAAGTSAPEISVSVMAALAGNGDLSVGNVIGSNIFNLGFILGIIALISPQVISKKMVYRDGLVLTLSTLLVLLFVWNQHVSFLEGLIMLVLLFAYNVYLFVKKDAPELDQEELRPAKWYDFVIFFVGLFFLIKASDYVVEAAVSIASSFGMSEWAIGVTIVAAGTSLPEIATAVAATFKKKFDLAVGNVVGSDIFNALGIIGVSAFVAPIDLKSRTEIFGMPDNVFSLAMLVVTIVLILIFMRTGWKISRREGALLLLIAVARMGFEIYIGA